MKLDPNTKVAGLLAAIPSSALVFKRFGIWPNAADDWTVEQACGSAGVEFHEFLRAMEEIDWHDEVPHSPGA